MSVSTNRRLRRIVERRNSVSVDGPAGAMPQPSSVVDCAVYVDGERLSGHCGYADAIAEEWQAELRLIEDWFATFGDLLPVGLRDELRILRHRLQPPS